MQTRLYRIVGMLVNGAGVITIALAAYGPGLGLSPQILGLILAAANGVIFIGRQILDPSTKTVPTNVVSQPS
jgi:hypothetical protein